MFLQCCGGSNIAADEYEQSPAPISMGTPLDIKDIAHRREFREAYGKGDRACGNPFVQQRVREVRIRGHDFEVVSETVKGRHNVKNDAGNAEGLQNVSSFFAGQKSGSQSPYVSHAGPYQSPSA